MKVFVITIIAVILLVLGYFVAIYAGVDLPKPKFLEKSIEGSATLEVKLLMDNRVNPVTQTEVDLSEKPGFPPRGGVAVTNESGIATFKVKPGTYYIYFNENTFPKNLKVPELEQVIIKEGVANEKTILITAKKE